MHNRKYSTTDNRIVRIKEDRIFSMLDSLAQKHDMCLQDVFDAFCESFHDIAIRSLRRNTEDTMGEKIEND